ncbi:MAG: ribonuclease Z [bacterium]|nr:ribonuclease Z [bacterium]
MKIIFLGTNGGFTTETGNTPSILIDTKNYYVILDAGNGIHKLDQYIKEDKPIHLFISHLHIDHIEGLHVFPIFHFKNNMTIFVQKGQTDLLKIFVNVPYSHAFKNLKFQVDFKELNEENTLPYSLSTKLLNHVIPCIGMRFEIEEKIISYCTDTGVCDNALLLGNNVDVFIHECSNFKNYDNSWGHVTPEIAG